MTATALTLWDASVSPPQSDQLLYTWNGYLETDAVHSLLGYVETHGDRLRRQYLAWIHELGESRIKGKRLVEHLAVDDHLSLWWMTLLTEKNPWKQPAINDAVRLLAVEEIVVGRNVVNLRLVSADRRLDAVLRLLAQRLGIQYEWQRLPQPHRRLSVRRIAYKLLPSPLKALFGLGSFFLKRLPFRKSAKSVWCGGEQVLFFCSYFFNLVPGKAKEGQFYSRYWEKLHLLTQEMGIRENWMHLYYPHDAVPTPSAAKALAARFNHRQQDATRIHNFLDSYLSWRMVVIVLGKWLRFCWVAWRLGRRLEEAFCPPGSRLSLWPLMREDWHASLCGPVAVANLMWIKLFDAAVAALPYQEKGFYICENQPWERALLSAWRKHGHGSLIAVAHATVRFWDLRYYVDPRTLCASGEYPLPRPDLTALNGKAAVDAYLAMDYPREAIVECEALRYGYLNDLKKKNPRPEGKGKVTKVLVLGDYLLSVTSSALKLLGEVDAEVTVGLNFTIKPHPNAPVRAAEFPGLDFSIVTEPLGEILQDYDLVYASNTTSAAVDAYLVGLPVVVKLDDGELNFSPLRGHDGVAFVSTPNELTAALTVRMGPVANAGGDDIFFLDPEFPRWRQMLLANVVVGGGSRENP